MIRTAAQIAAYYDQNVDQDRKQTYPPALVDELLALVLAAAKELREHESKMRTSGAFTDAARARKLRKALERVRAALISASAAG